MILIDSDVFVLDLFYPADTRIEATRRFLEGEGGGRATTIFNVLEVCGIASFNRSSEDITRLFQAFHQIYDLDVLYPKVPAPFSEEILTHLVARTFVRVLRKMNFSDALILTTAESFNVSTLVTWNVKHFENRTTIQVITPEEFLRGSV